MMDSGSQPARYITDLGAISPRKKLYCTISRDRFSNENYCHARGIMLLDVVVINARVSTRTGNSKSNFVGRPAEFVVSGANLTPTEVAAVTHFHIKTATRPELFLHFTSFQV